MKLSARDAAVVVDDDVEMDVEEVSVVPAGSKPEVRGALEQQNRH